MKLTATHIDYGSFALLLISIIVASQAIIMQYVPVQYAALAIGIFAVLSQIGSNYAKNEIKNAQPEPEQPANEDTA
jgi:hypothetical protein